MEKKELRVKMKKIRDQLPIEERRQADRTIFNILKNLDEIKSSRVIYTYVSFGSEVSTREIMAWCLDQKKCLAVPGIEGKEMNFYRVTSLSELVPGIWGIPEPAGKRQPVTQPGIMLVPGPAFDKKGYRLGYGGGFYDRYLARRPDLQKTSIGLAYQVQLVDKLPVEACDLPVQRIVR